MIKNNLEDDMKFISKSVVYYGIPCNRHYISNDMIVLESPKENIVVLLDEHYNTVDIIEKKVDLDKQLSNIKKRYEETGLLPYPFNNYSLKQFNDLAERIDVEELNHGHSSQLYVNCDLVSDKDDSEYALLLYYIKFISEQLNGYYYNLYQMKMMNLEYPDAYKYIESLTTNLNEYIEKDIITRRRTHPGDIMGYLGQSNRGRIDEYSTLLYKIITLKLKQHNLKIKGGDDYDKLVKTRKEPLDLEEVADNLLKLLEVPYRNFDWRNQTCVKAFERGCIKREERRTIRLEKTLSE